MFPLCLHRCLKPYRLGCYIFSVMMEGLCCLFVTLLQTFPLLVPFAVLYGYFDGAYVALIPVVTSDLVGSQQLSSALGVVYFLHGIPYLISPPIGGEEASRQIIIDVKNLKSAEEKHQFLFCGSDLLRQGKGGGKKKRDTSQNKVFLLVSVHLSLGS